MRRQLPVIPMAFPELSTRNMLDIEHEIGRSADELLLPGMTVGEKLQELCKVYLAISDVPDLTLDEVLDLPNDIVWDLLPGLFGVPGKGKEEEENGPKDGQ